MAMPPQLAEGLKRRVKGRPPRPLIENLPGIAVHKLPIPSQNDPKTYKIPNISLVFSSVSGARLSRDVVEFHLPSLHRNTLGPIQTFGIKHIKAGFGIRHAFVCDCGRGALKLYCFNGRLACRRCHHAVPASQSLSRRQRPILQVSRIQSFLAKPRLKQSARAKLTKKLGQKLMLAQGRMGTQAHPLLD
jgi:hypothetical protein